MPNPLARTLCITLAYAVLTRLIAHPAGRHFRDCIRCRSRDSAPILGHALDLERA